MSVDHKESLVERPASVYLGPPVSTPYQSYETELHLRDYLRVLRKYFGVIASCLAGMLFLAALYTFSRVPLYRAVATVQIDRMPPTVLDPATAWMTYYWDAEFLETQIKLMRSRAVAKRVVNADPTLREKIKKSDPKDPSFNLERAYQPAVRAALGGLEITPVKNSNLVEITYVSADPNHAQRLANLFAEQFIEWKLESKFQTTQEATSFLGEQIDRLQKEIKARETELLSYGSEVNILSPEIQDSIVAQRMQATSLAYIEAQAQRIEKEIAYRSLQSAGAAGRPELLDHPMLLPLSQELATLHQRAEELSTKYKSDWPELARLRQQIAQLEARRQRERERLYGDLLIAARNEYQQVLQREQSFAAALDGQKNQANQLNQNAIYYNTLKLEIDNKKALLDSLLKRQSETGVQARLQGVKTSNVQIVDSAEYPEAPYTPNHRRDLLLGFALGIGLGIGLAFFLDYFDNTIKSPDDLYRAAQLPALGVVPKLGAAPTWRKLLPGSTGNGGGHLATRQASVKATTGNNDNSAFAEAFKLVRGSVLLSSMDRPPRSLLVTSSAPSEGKTTISVNLAISLAQADKNVLLIDADMRRPQIHRMLELRNKVGLSNILAGQATPNLAIQRTQIKGLFVLCCGTVPPNPSELLSGRRLRGLLKGCDKVFDMVIIDSPPVLSFIDAVHVGALVEGVLLVVEAGETPRELLLRARRRFEEAHARVLGVVINKLDLQRDGYYYSYYYKSYYSYSEPHGDQASTSAGANS